MVTEIIWVYMKDYVQMVKKIMLGRTQKEGHTEIIFFKQTMGTNIISLNISWKIQIRDWPCSFT